MEFYVSTGGTDTLFEPDRVQIAIRFIDVAERDLEAAKILLEVELYPQALFMLQQAMEKAVKAVMYAMAGLSIRELKRDVSHKVLKRGFQLMIERVSLKFQRLTYNLPLQPGSIKLLCAYEEVRQLFVEVVKRVDEAIRQIERKLRSLPVMSKSSAILF